jgi:glutamate racemase
MKSNGPIGIFDSGVGGLTLLREMESLLPYEDFIYFGDTARMPYGVRTERDVVNFSEQIFDWLTAQDCKLIIMACNTISGLYPEMGRCGRNAIPLVGMINYGSVAAALYVTYSFRIGVLATKRTVQSRVYRKIIDHFDPTVHLYPQECTELIPLIEEGMIGSPTTRSLSEKYLVPLLKKNVDTLILGCTHLPFIRTIIQDITGPSVTIIDPARRTAVLATKVLEDHGLRRKNRSRPGKKHFFVTGDPVRFEETASLLLNKSIGKVKKVTL